MLCGSQRLYLLVELIHITSLLEYLAQIDDACTLVGQWVPTILDSSAARKYTIYNLYTLASFGQSAPRGHINILLWQYRIVVNALSVSGRYVHVHLCLLRMRI